MSKKEIILEILKSIKPTMNLENVTDIIDGGYLDSLGLMTLITEMCEKFDFDMDIDWITPDNFNSVEAMVSLVERMKK